MKNVPSPLVDCPVDYCAREAGYCCLDERGAVRRKPHPERLALEAEQARAAGTVKETP